MRNTRRFLAMILAVVMALACVSVAAADAQPDSWIADRTIVVQAYVDDIGYNLPDDLNATPVMQKITELTGIKLEIRYTPRRQRCHRNSLAAGGGQHTRCHNLLSEQLYPA